MIDLKHRKGFDLEMIVRHHLGRLRLAKFKVRKDEYSVSARRRQTDNKWIPIEKITRQLREYDISETE